MAPLMAVLCMTIEASYVRSQGEEGGLILLRVTRIY